MASGEPHKGLVFKHKKTRLEESKCNRNLGLDTFSDSVLKFKANASVDALVDYEEEECSVEGEAGSIDPVSGGIEQNFFDKKHTAADFEKSCEVAITTVIYSQHTAELEPYLQQVFSLPSEKYRALINKAKKKESPDLILMCTVLSGEGLLAKDANGKSDPYCKMTILSRKHQDSQQVRQKYIADWQKANLVKNVLQTTVRPETLNPEWNEHFELSIVDPQNDLLVIEIWDSDEEQVGVTKIKGLRGLGNFIADLRKGVDDFMGRAFYLLSTIPSKGERKTLDLYNQSGKSKLGTIKVDLRIRGLREGLSQEAALEEQLRLTRAVIDSESKKKGHYCRRWDGKLSQNAHRLLDLHAESSGLINKLQQAGVLLNVLMDYHKSYAVQVATFCDIIAHIKSFKYLLPEKALEGKTSKDLPIWVSSLFADVHELASYIFDVMKDHLLVFDLKKVQGVRRLESHVVTLKEIFSFHAFSLKLNEKYKSLTKALEISIETAVKKAFRFLNSKAEPLRNDPEDRLRAFKGLVQHWLHQTQRCIKDIAPFFTEIRVDYMTWYFKTLDPELCDEAAWLKTYRAAGEESHTMTFELYLAMRELYNLTEHVDKSVRDKLKLRNFHVLFSPMVPSWIDLAQTLCKKRIDMAIEIDKVIQVTDEATFSSSAVDAKGFLLQVGAFWKHLEWPTVAESYSYAAAVVQYTCDCAVYYVGKVYTRVRDEDLYKDGKFHASEKLCIILNNMLHLEQALEGLSETLELDKYYQWLDEQDQLVDEPDRVAVKAKGLIDSLLKNANEDIDNKISLILQNISEKVNIRGYIETIMNARKEVPEEETIAPLMDYLTVNLQILGDFLLHPIFWRILNNFWEMSLQAISELLLTVPKKQGSKFIQSRFHFTLQMLRDFFYAGGSGLSLNELEGEEYMRLLGDLEITSLSTSKLILRFNMDLFQQCNAEKEKASRGTLTVSVGYLKHRNAVEVTVIGAKNLPGLDKSGLSDPFVELSLQPHSLFMDKQVKTSIKKQTVDPIFNEEFLLPVTKPEVMEVDGAMLLMAVFDYDKMSSNDLCGLCVIPCKRIPKLARGGGSITKPTGPERKNYHLPVFLVQPTVAYRELEARKEAGDSDAQHFFKVFKPYLDDLAPSSSRRGRLSIRKS